MSDARLEPSRPTPPTVLLISSTDVCLLPSCRCRVSIQLMPTVDDVADVVVPSRQQQEKQQQRQS
jgi:hypothetical protein